MSKLFAAREKDIAFVSAMLKHRLVHRETLKGRIGAVPKWRDRAREAEERLKRIG